MRENGAPRRPGRGWTPPGSGAILILFVAGLSLQNAAAPGPARAESAGPRGTLSMDRAVELALERATPVRVAEAELGLARGGLEGARVRSRGHNPELSGGAGIRFGAAGPAAEADIGLSQAFDLGRPRPRRLAVARAELAAAEDRGARARIRVAAEARVAYAEATAAEQRLRLAEQAEELARRLHRTVEELAGADATTALEQNLAAIEWASARRQVARGRREVAEARAELQGLLGLPPGERLVLDETTPPRTRPGRPVEDLRARALATRRDLAALDREVEAAEAELELARAERWPALALSATYSFEDSDHIVGVGVSVPLPLFDRGQGEVARARAGLELARVEREAARLAVEREVVLALAALEAAIQSSELLGTDTVGLVADNFGLLELALAEGEVGLVQVLLVQRELIAARREAVDVATAVLRAAVRLDLAVGEEVR